MALTEVVYKNRDNPVSPSFYEDHVAMDFTAVTRMVIKLYNNNLVLQATVDSNASPNLLSWAGNTLTATLNDLALADGRYRAEVIAYDTAHPDGQVIAHPLNPADRLIFRFVNA